MHALDQAIHLTPVAEDTGRHISTGATSAAYANMVGPFGGITGATLLNAALQHPQRQGDPIALTVNFAGPVADGPFQVTARPVRTNRSTQHWSMELTQDAGTAATATAVFAQRRETWSAPEAQAPLDVPPAASLQPSPSLGRPTWVQRYDMRFVEGDLPKGFDAQEQAQSGSVLWIRDEPPRPLDFASLAALCDSFFPRIFIRRRALTPIGTVSLTTYFHADEAMLRRQGDRHVLGVARALRFHNGYYDQSAELWSDDGHLLASSHQMVYFRE
ncbi:MAG: thioesterase family protein [Rubrivivax sp.]|nr:MAG: thioesterase family protein [Rubrivivax sp.]